VAVKAKMRRLACLDDANDLAEEAGVAYHLVNLVQDDDPHTLLHERRQLRPIGFHFSDVATDRLCLPFSLLTRLGDASVTVMTGTDPDREVATAMCCFRNGFVGLSRMALSTSRRAWPVGWAP
jgi:hypothetical protein